MLKVQLFLVFLVLMLLCGVYYANFGFSQKSWNMPKVDEEKDELKARNAELLKQIDEFEQ